MDHLVGKPPTQVIYREVNTTKGRPRKSWIAAIYRQDLKEIGMSWEEAREHKRSSWPQRTLTSICGPICLLCALNQWLGTN